MLTTIKAENYSMHNLDEIKEYDVRGFRERGITKTVSDHYGVRVSYSEDGSIHSHFYPYTKDGVVVAYKQRELPKSFRVLGDFKGVQLFGQSSCQGGRRIVITEGELDCLAVAQAQYDKYGQFYPVVAMPSSTATSMILEQREWLRSFEEVVLMLDMDEPGKKATEAVAKVIGYDKVKIATLPAKDPCEVLIRDGGSKTLMMCVFDARPYSPAGIVRGQAVWEQYQNRKTTQSVPYPQCLEGINDKIAGMRMGEIVLFTSGTGCFAKDTEILMANGSVKKVQDVVVGDMVAGEGSTSVNVKTLFRGKEEMARITLRDKTSFVVNKSHILSLVNSDSEGRWGCNKDDVVDVTVSDYLKWSDKRKHLFKSFKTVAKEFPKQELLIDPYVLGVWLGDGSSEGATIYGHIDDRIIVDTIANKGYTVNKSKAEHRWNLPGRLRMELNSLGLLKNKHIPEQYLTSCINDRLQLLAGLLDTDGCYDSVKNMYEFSQKKLHITLAVKRLCESLGFSVSMGKQVNNKFGNCYRLHIGGAGLEQIPCKLPRKQARERKQIKDPHRYSFTVETLPEDDFYGFEVDGNGRFVLGNFVVTHNSGKSTVIKEIVLDLLAKTPDMIGMISLEESIGDTAQKFIQMQLRTVEIDNCTDDEQKEAFDKVFGDERLILLDHQGSVSDESLVDKMEYLALLGCKYIILDHITLAVSEGTEGKTGNEAIDSMMSDLLKLVKKHNIWLGVISHLRKGKNDQKAFEEGRLASLDDVKGSGSIKQISFDVIAFARNMVASDEQERNTIKFRVLKSRFTGKTGDCGSVLYNTRSGRLESVTLADFD